MIVVAKIGTSSLTDDHGEIALSAIDKLCAEVTGLRGAGHRVVIVTSGAISAGLPALGFGGARPSDLETLQAISAVGQSRLMRAYDDALERHGLVGGQVLLAPLDFVHRSQYLHARATLRRLLDLGVVPVVNENDAVADDEIRFGDNDRLAALVAHLVHADLLVLLSDVDGLYDGPPSAPGSRLIADVRHEADLDGVVVGKTGGAGVGTGGMQTKLEAARIATGAGIPVVLTDAGQVDAALAGKTVGTLFHPTGRRRPTRLLWLAHATEGKGVIRLDAGAVRAVTERRASLLPAGITAVSGTFAAGDPVDLVDPDGRAIARGLVNYDAAELPALLGRTTRELARELGASYEREVVHRDDMTLLDQ
jgi:glutamate 5-kinase